MSDILQAVPRPRPGSELKGFDLTAEQAFVFSRLDGWSTVADICALTGLGEAATLGALKHLKALGLIALDGVDPEPSRGRRASLGPRGKSSGAGRSRPPSTPPVAAEEAPPLPADPEAPPELDEPGVELSLAQKKRILELYGSLATAHFYDLLGVFPRADRKTIRQAYFRLSKEFHPDSHFGKKIGSFHDKLERIFGRIAEAYGILTHKTKRAEYDAYIADQIAAAEMEERLREADREAERLLVEMERERIEAALPKRDVAEAAALRRRALRQKLAGGRRLPDRRRARPEAAEAPPRDAKAVAAEIKRVLGTEPLEEERRERARRCAETARSALEEEDFIAAVNSINLAATLDPGNETYRREKETTTRKARAALAVTYARQGRYEESLGHNEEACRNYLKAAHGQPNQSSFLERAAALLITTRGDLHQAQELARKAVEIKPEEASYRVTLASVYEAAKLPRNAKRELDAALGLDPKHEEAHALLKRIRKLL